MNNLEQMTGVFKEFCIEYLDDFKKSIKGMKWLGNGVWCTEAFCLCAFTSLYNCDIIIDVCNDGNGVSTEILARCFPDISIKHLCGNVKSDSVFNLHKKVNKYRNVEVVKGDVLNNIKTIVSNKKKSRIGIFFDGPKDYKAINIAKKIFNNVYFFGFHDVKRNQDKAKKIFEKWKRVFLYTDDGWFRNDYGHLDNSNQRKNGYPNGPGSCWILTGEV